MRTSSFKKAGSPVESESTDPLRNMLNACNIALKGFGICLNELKESVRILCSPQGQSGTSNNFEAGLILWDLLRAH